jgi:Flp pilus assembly protein TadD
MSVLNRMLSDLAARGAVAAPAHRLDGAAALSAREAVGTRLPARGTRHRQWLFWSVIAVASIAVVASMPWFERNVRTVRLSGTPLGAAQFGAAVDVEARALVPLGPQAAAPLPSAPPSPASIEESAPVSPPVVTPRRSDTPTTSKAALALPAPAEHRAQPTARPDQDVAALASEPRAGAPPTIRRPAAGSGPSSDHYTRATELIARGRHHEAMDHLLQLLAVQPAHGDARAALAALQAEAGWNERALATLLAGVATDPRRFAPPAAQLHNELGDTAAALVTLERIPHALREGSHEALLGGLAFRAGQYARAADAYERALRSEHPAPVWWIGLGLAQEAAGRRNEAHAAYQRLARATALPAEMQGFIAQRLAATAPLHNSQGSDRAPPIAAAAP